MKLELLYEGIKMHQRGREGATCAFCFDNFKNDIGGEGGGTIKCSECKALIHKDCWNENGEECPSCRNRGRGEGGSGYVRGVPRSSRWRSGLPKNPPKGMSRKERDRLWARAAHEFLKEPRDNDGYHWRF